MRGASRRALGLATSRAGIWRVAAGRRTFAGMDQLNSLHLSIRAWLLLGALAYVAWVLNAVVEGSTALAIIVGPILVCLWVAGVLLIDRWARKGSSQPE
jgi:hypothetical protein